MGGGKVVGAASVGDAAFLGVPRSNSPRDVLIGRRRWSRPGYAGGRRDGVLRSCLYRGKRRRWPIQRASVRVTTSRGMCGLCSGRRGVECIGIAFEGLIGQRQRQAAAIARGGLVPVEAVAHAAAW